jgi:hypothetical protein
LFVSLYCCDFSGFTFSNINSVFDFYLSEKNQKSSFEAHQTSFGSGLTSFGTSGPLFGPASNQSQFETNSGIQQPDESYKNGANLQVITETSPDPDSNTSVSRTHTEADLKQTGSKLFIENHQRDPEVIMADFNIPPPKLAATITMSKPLAGTNAGTDSNEVGSITAGFKKPQPQLAATITRSKPLDGTNAGTDSNEVGSITAGFKKPQPQLAATITRSKPLDGTNAGTDSNEADAVTASFKRPQPQLARSTEAGSNRLKPRPQPLFPTNTRASSSTSGLTPLVGTNTDRLLQPLFTTNTEAGSNKAALKPQNESNSMTPNLTRFQPPQIARSPRSNSNKTIPKPPGGNQARFRPNTCFEAPKQIGFGRPRPLFGTGNLQKPDPFSRSQMSRMETLRWRKETVREERSSLTGWLILFFSIVEPLTISLNRC